MQMSSAYAKILCVKVLLNLADFKTIGSISELLSIFLINGSSASINRPQESASPCLTPRWMDIGLV
jgi:hypothetical protein